MTVPTIEIGTEARELAERVKVAAGEQFVAIGFTGLYGVTAKGAAFTRWGVQLSHWNTGLSPATEVCCEGPTPLAALKEAIAKSPWAGEVL